ncbi:hypothetical protein D3C76_1647400 [compost metagenome]
MPLYTFNSTIFGSTIRSLTSSGLALYRMLVIIPLIHTDLPEPVAPATNKWGILARLATMGWPEISRPRVMVSLEGES